MQKPALDVAAAFQSHDKARRDTLIATIQTMGGMPVAEKSLDDYASALNAATLKTQADVLALQAAPASRDRNALCPGLASFTKVYGRLPSYAHCRAILSSHDLEATRGSLF